MSEPLFYNLLCKKNLGWYAFACDVFGYDIQATMSESTGLFLLTQMVFLLLRMVVMPVKPWMFFMQSIVSCSVIVREPVFPL